MSLTVSMAKCLFEFAAQQVRKMSLACRACRVLPSCASRPAASPEAGSSVVITSLDSAFVRNSLFLNKCFVSIKTEGGLATCARLNFTDVNVAGAAAASVLRQRPPRWKRFWTQILWF